MKSFCGKLNLYISNPEQSSMDLSYAKFLPVNPTRLYSKLIFRQMMSAGAKRPAPPPRKPSPPRQNNQEEQTFKDKLEEIKRMRSAGGGETKTSTQISRRTINEEPLIPKQVQTLTGLKTFLKSFGDWVEVVSKTGKVYYYNKKAKTNQWKKPEEWLTEERRINAPPPLPEVYKNIKPEEPPMPTEDPPLPPEAPRVKMKLKMNKKITKRLKKESKLPLSYQKNPALRLDESSDEDENKEKLTMKNAFEDPEDEGVDSALTKLEKADEIGHIDIKLPEPKPDHALDTKPDLSLKSETEPGENTMDPNPYVRKFTSTAPGNQRGQNLPKGSAAELAFNNITKISETTAIYGDGVTNLLTTETGNPTFFTEYNLPCCLRRCKFPKEQVNSFLFDISNVDTISNTINIKVKY